MDPQQCSQRQVQVQGQVLLEELEQQKLKKELWRDVQQKEDDRKPLGSVGLKRELEVEQIQEQGRWHEEWEEQQKAREALSERRKNWEQMEQ